LGYYNNSEIKLHTGPYGNYLKYGGKNYNLAYNKHPTLEESIKIIDKKIKTKK
jgi:topoisomerase IA-like protein